jgi:hypothetical protein
MRERAVPCAPTIRLLRREGLALGLKRTEGQTSSLSGNSSSTRHESSCCLCYGRWAIVIQSGGVAGRRSPDPFAKEKVMECDICGEKVKNSDELLKHVEQQHPADEGDKSVNKLEMPDMLGATQEESSEREVPKPLH